MELIIHFTLHREREKKDIILIQFYLFFLIEISHMIWGGGKFCWKLRYSLWNIWLHTFVVDFFLKRVELKQKWTLLSLIHNIQ